MPERNHEPTYHLLGVPLRTGSLYPGSENDAQAYRDVQLLQRLEAAGCRVIDEGDVAIPSYLFRERMLHPESPSWATWMEMNFTSGRLPARLRLWRVSLFDISANYFKWCSSRSDDAIRAMPKDRFPIDFVDDSLIVTSNQP